MLFSVIIPVYNVEAYLPRCIDSVLKQTCRDYEILLIDDGSEDASGKICEEYAKRHKNCQVVHQANAGLASARNVGLDRARGKYIVFLDSDDYIEKELLMKAGQALEKDGYDVCSYAVRRIAEDESCLYEMLFGSGIGDFDFALDDRLRFMLLDFLQYKVGWEVCFFVYRRSIIEERGLRFREEITYAEDMLFTLQYLLYAKTLVKIPDILYNYTLRRTSITSQKTCKGQIQGMFGANYLIMKDILATELKEKKPADLEVLLYSAMLLYFMPRYLKMCSESEVRETLLSCSGAKEIWSSIPRKRKVLSDVFSAKEAKRIIDWVEGR